ncbi:hypothetical protein KW502_12925 [Mesonia sp. JHPTF-M18]|uniref:Prenyltransferase n=2 Tax=Mesonia aestuariivivens TaxID=2796128 RepID=A0ABS6W4B5_9FLAO|nr:hypothetical protein [Mesonia aestuariivivens]
MSWLKAIFKFYIDSSIHVSLAVCALVLTTTYVFDITVSLELLAFVFLSTITGYNFVKYAGLAGLHHRTLTKNLQAIQSFSFLNFILLVWLAFHVPLNVLIISGGLGLFTLLYAIPFLPQGKNLRSLKTLKIFIIAFVWAVTAIMLPLEKFELILSITTLWRFLQIFVLILALMLPFEIRDLTYDNNELKTIPQLIGVLKTKHLGYLLLVCFFLFEFLISTKWSNLISALLISLVTSIMIYFSSKEQSKYYASFWVESIPIFWLGFLWWSDSVLLI